MTVPKKNNVIKVARENWIYLLLFIPLLISAFFLLTPYSIISLTISWSMLGISVGFYISFSDSEETLKAFHKLILSQSALLVTQMDYVEKKIGVPRDASYNVVQNNRIMLVAEIKRLEIKINNIKNKMSMFSILSMLYLIMAVFITIYNYYY